MTRIGLVGDPENLLWDGTGLRESDDVTAPNHLLRDAGFEVVRGAAPDEVDGIVVLASSHLAWSLALARRRGFARVVVLCWPSDDDLTRAAITKRLRAAGFAPDTCPILEPSLEEEGDPEWGTQFTVLDVPSTELLVAALRDVCSAVPEPRAIGGRLDELLATIESSAIDRCALPVERGQLTDDEAWSAVVLDGGRIGRTLVDAAPYVEDGAWPTCTTCGQPMSTVFQVDPADGPYAAQFAGLYVAFVCCAFETMSTVVRYHPEPRVERRRELALPPTDRFGGRLGYLLERGGRELAPRAWSALPSAAQAAFAKPLDDLDGEELYEALAAIVAAPQASDASAGGGVDAPPCERCGGVHSLVFATTYLAGGDHVYELWACACSPERASLTLRPAEALIR